MIEISEHLNTARDAEVKYRGADGLEVPHLELYARGHTVELFGSEVDNLRRMLMGAANREDAAGEGEPIVVEPITVDEIIEAMRDPDST